MESERVEKCRDCYFFWQEPPDKGRGQCRRHPPAVDFNDEFAGAFPVIGEDDWCGEFKPAAVAPRPEEPINLTGLGVRERAALRKAGFVRVEQSGSKRSWFTVPEKPLSQL